MLFDQGGLPRYWATAWTSFLPSDLAESTLAKKLGPVDSFYGYADEIGGPGSLDNALAALNIEALGQLLEGYFFRIKDIRTPNAHSQMLWRAALEFAKDILTRITHGAETATRFHELNAKLTRVEMLYSQLNVHRRRRVEPIRSLPRSVVNALYDMLDPSSSTNPFGGAVSRWRVYVIFTTLLRLGLRRGELLTLPVDAVKTGLNDQLKRQYWVKVANNEYEDDPRFSKPSIKTHQSLREVPVSELTERVITEYVISYRGRPDHSFLVNSRSNKPLSTEGVTKIFQKITAALPVGALKDLREMTGNVAVTPHTLRHTSVVMRIDQLRSRGTSMEEVLQQIRPLFGWSRSSDMPQRYARAYFEDSLSAIWSNEFDDRAAILRAIPRGL